MPQKKPSGIKQLVKNKEINMCVHVYVVYEDTNLYIDMGMTSPNHL